MSPSSPTPPDCSLLFLRRDVCTRLVDATEPACFPDLNLDQLVATLCSGRRAADLQELFWTPLERADEIRYRQAALHDCRHPEVGAAITRFVTGIDRVAEHLSLMRQVRFALQRQRCLLDAARAYCTAVRALGGDLLDAHLTSAALTDLRDFLSTFVDTRSFTELEQTAQETADGLDEIRYRLHVRGDRVRVRAADAEGDLGAYVAELFAPFRDHGEPGAPMSAHTSGGFSHVEGQILSHVADLFPHQFGRLVSFSERFEGFADPTILHLHREMSFVLAWLDLESRLGERGLTLTLPQITSRELSVRASFDLALAATSDIEVVTNDVEIRPPQQMIVVTGPNQGGKTTCARMLGQVAYLTSIGCPVPAERATVPMVDAVFVQSERREDPSSARGKLQDELVRAREICRHATGSSMVILNEVFSSTTTEDGLRLAQRVLQMLLDRGCIGMCVTFLDELATDDPRLVSMVAEVRHDDPRIRTFRLSRRPADGRAYADAIADRYRLSREQIASRIAR